ncbi:two-component system response regulator CreB [Atopomonas sediminilitoris]|uniref:two-component system response regulator CreB n=1 Tax=Atopomonas sediminilitoris TaxID=2919919 RepID=UPI001F4EECB1|nr:two-component system response regulator CreB [Atopomonas sediminilitoris]MCJ8169274.1 two-component system response regulator CreB [Atopomonas sediminilitoris]
MAKLLLVEDEPAIADTLLFSLRREGHEVQWLTLAEPALALLNSQSVDLLILDVGLPDIDGFEACRRLRRFSQVPVLFLTALDSEIDRVVGFEIGADDYVCKPFSPREVGARIRAILKRMESVVAPTTLPHTAGPFTVNVERVQVHYRQQLLNLTAHEFKLLQALLAQPERVFSREQLLDALGVPSDAGYERNIDSHIKALRSKLREIIATTEPIKTHRGLGYSYQPSQA